VPSLELEALDLREDVGRKPLKPIKIIRQSHGRLLSNQSLLEGKPAHPFIEKFAWRLILIAGVRQSQIIL
jgi:hypothetical protein